MPLTARPLSPSPLTETAFLDRMRRTGDPEADILIGEIFASGRVQVINDMLATLEGNDESAPARIPAEVAEYLGVTKVLPPWADPARILRAQGLFMRHGPLFGVVLMLSSLPVLYAGSFGGAQVLAMTGQLTRNFRRRASETLRFILDVMEPGGLDANGRGIRTTQKVRLMHASIRQFALHAGAWKSHPEWGAPINQEELAGTLVAFSCLALEGLEKLGIEVERQDQEDYLHAWKCIGHVLGIRPDCLPADMAEAKALWKQVGKRNFHRTPEGLELVREHLKFVKEMIPGHLVDRLPESLMRFLMGPRIACGILGLPKAAWTDILIDWMRRALWLERIWIFKGRLMKAVISGISRELMESLHAYWSQGGPPPFRIPTSLGDSPGTGPSGRPSRASGGPPPAAGPAHP